ncbi:MAG: hypothetical protein HRU18_01440 [Pseudoalteromonas sp.]|uniref:hypothetical protein n=1 Tax=Pseudoalteromonas sp. TaxID=53249 RepID=UPI001D540619|nr:hypothetical protein [Pseudoalteromonas sp.]NRA76844.1 hypothetical protein [Pseudoalteromonas sp.]
METRRRRRRRNSKEEETEIKPKRVRGERASTESKEVKVPPKKDLTKPLLNTNYDNVLRLQNYKDFKSMLGSDSLVDLLGACYASDRATVEALINNPNATLGELQAVVLATDAIDSESTTRLRSKQYIDERLFGKSKDKIEVTGADGKPLEMEVTEKKKSIKDASKEEIDILIKAMQIAKKKNKAESEDES